MARPAHTATTGLLGRLRGVTVGIVIATVASVAIAAGLAVTPSEVLPGLPGSGSLDYGALPGRAFVPLTDEFIAEALGITLPPVAPLDEGDEDRPVPATTLPVGGSVTPSLRTGERHALTNDDRASAFEIRAIPFSGRTDPSDASREPDEPSTCANGSRTVWYRHTATQTAPLRGHAVVSQGGVAVAVHEGQPDDLREVACEDSNLFDNVARVLFDATAGATYWFQVSLSSQADDLVFSLDPLGSTRRVSVAPGGGDPDKATVFVDVSADGQRIVYESWATNLVPNDDNNAVDVFVFDVATGETRMVSVASDGTPGNGNSGMRGTAISPNGRYVGFTSTADNLVDGDTNERADVFVHDLETGETTRISVASDGSQGVPPGTPGVYLAQQELCHRVGDDDYLSVVEDPAFRFRDAPLKCSSSRERVSFSDDGRYVAFDSPLAGLVPNDRGRNGADLSAGDWSTTTLVDFDVFVHDQVLGTTRLVSVGMSGTSGDQFSRAPDISGDGRYVSFVSLATDLVDGPTNGFTQIYVRDLWRDVTELVSVDTDGQLGNNDSDVSSISDDGRWIAFDSLANNFDASDTNSEWDVYVHDRLTSTTDLVTSSSVDEREGIFGAVEPSISADGRFIAFSAYSGDGAYGIDYTAVEARQDIHVFDRLLATTTMVSVSSEGEAPDDSSFFPRISPDGQHVVFTSEASNLDPGDHNNLPAEFDRVDGVDAFLHTLPVVR